MKTTCQIISSSRLTIRKVLPLGALVRSIGRILPVVAGIAFVQLSLISHAAAAAPNGQYLFSNASGSLKIGGETIDLSDYSLGGFGALDDGKATVRNNRVQIYTKEAAAMLDNLISSYPVTVNVSGPSSLALKKKGTIYAGTSQPIALTISGSVEGRKISGKLQWIYKVVVRGKKLIATAPISGSIAGMKVSGTISITCIKR